MNTGQLHEPLTVSHETLDVRVEVEERAYGKRASAQEVASSLMGISMAASGCPVLAKLRPMARFHLPFATVEETLYRVLSMHLLAQYLAARKQGKPADWSLKGLIELYREIGTVNEHFFLRLRGEAVEDASLNALVRLHAFSSEIPFSVEEQMLDDLEPVFSAYLEQPPQI